MRSSITFTLSARDRQRLEAVVADRNAPQKHVWRARIILLSADGLGTNTIMAATRTAKGTVWRWQERFMREGVDGLLRDRTRRPGVAPGSDDRAGEVVRLTLSPPPHEATHWTAAQWPRRPGWQCPASRRSGRRMVWSRAASLAALQTLERSRLRGQAACRGRALRETAGARRGAERRWEVSDPGP